MCMLRPANLELMSLWEEFVLESAARGFQVYKTTWTPAVDKLREQGNEACAGNN